MSEAKPKRASREKAAASIANSADAAGPRGPGGPSGQDHAEPQGLVSLPEPAPTPIAETRRVWTELAARLVDGRSIADAGIPKLHERREQARDYGLARAAWLESAKRLADAIGGPKGRARVLERLRAAAGADAVTLADLGANPKDRKLQALLDEVDQRADWLEFTITAIARAWDPPPPSYRASP